MHRMLFETVKSGTSSLVTSLATNLIFLTFIRSWIIQVDNIIINIWVIKISTLAGVSMVYCTHARAPKNVLAQAYWASANKNSLAYSKRSSARTIRVLEKGLR